MSSFTLSSPYTDASFSTKASVPITSNPTMRSTTTGSTSPTSTSSGSFMSLQTPSGTTSSQHPTPPGSGGSSTTTTTNQGDQGAKFAEDLLSALNQETFQLVIAPQQVGDLLTVSSVVSESHYVALFHFDQQTPTTFTLDFGSFMNMSQVATTKFTDKNLTIVCPLIHFSLAYAMSANSAAHFGSAAYAYIIPASGSSASYYITQVPQLLASFSQCADADPRLCAPDIFKWVSTPPKGQQTQVYISKQTKPKFGNVAGLKPGEAESYSIFFTTGTGTDPGFRFHIGRSGMYSLSPSITDSSLLAPLVALGKALVSFNGYLVYATCATCTAGVTTGDFKIQKVYRVHDDIPMKPLMIAVEVALIVVKVVMLIIFFLFLLALGFFVYKIGTYLWRSSKSSNPSQLPVPPAPTATNFYGSDNYSF